MEAGEFASLCSDSTDVIASRPGTTHGGEGLTEGPKDRCSGELEWAEA